MIYVQLFIFLYFQAEIDLFFFTFTSGWDCKSIPETGQEMAPRHAQEEGGEGKCFCHVPENCQCLWGECSDDEDYDTVDF